MTRAFRMLANLLRDRAGNVLPIAAVGMLVAAAVVGSAIDLGRDYRTENELQAACDAAVLAGRRTVTTNGYDTAAQAAARTYFAANFDDTSHETRSTSFTSSTPDNGNTIDGHASTILDTLVMRLFGYDQFNLRVTCSASMGVGNADVMMVLDNTGSMGDTLSGSQTRIMALRAAMKNFYTTLSGATSGTNARVRYGFVPYSSSVNVGRLLYDLNPAYLVDKRTYQSRRFSSSTSTDYSQIWTSDWNRYSNTSYSTQTACNSAKPADQANFSNYGNPTNTTSGNTQTSTQPQLRYVYQCQAYTSGWSWYSTTVYYIEYRYYTRNKVTTTVSTYTYQPIEYDTSQYKRFAAVSTNTGNNGAAVSSTWAGCIEERATTSAESFNYNPNAGITPSSAWDVKIDDAPTSSDSTKWVPMWPEVAFRRWDGNGYYTTQTSQYGGEASSFCPHASRQLAEMSQSSFNAYADSMVALGSTYLDIGMIWGGRLISPDGIFADTVNIPPTNGGEVSRHIIFMTDGVMEPNYLIQSAWGMEYWDRRVTANGYNDDAARHTQRFLAVCEALKDKGVRVWVIAFTAALSSDLQACASTNSSFTAGNAATLNSAFQEIAKQVGELRITQ